MMNGMIMMNGLYWAIFIGVLLLSWIVSARMKSKFKKYSKIAIANGMTGKEVAEKMLRDNNILGVKVQSVQGILTDHYNPVDKTINLSTEVYNGNSVAAAAVAAHETGHAVQHEVAYSWLTLRSKLVPVVSFASNWIQWVLLLGVILLSRRPEILFIGIILFSITTLFSFITLPVEINASKRALVWLKDAGITVPGTQEKAEDALRSAAYTYVIAALGSLATLIYYIMLFLGARSR
ncbi:MAG TPA: zinc metallopeptidase [Bacteroidales bacterium]|nr:zinc metallopeptidase [Bacteroidales bacterium]